MIDAQFPRHFNGAVGAAVVDDQPFDFVDARNVPW